MHEPHHRARHSQSREQAAETGEELGRLGVALGGGEDVRLENALGHVRVGAVHHELDTTADERLLDVQKLVLQGQDALLAGDACQAGQDTDAIGRVRLAYKERTLDGLGHDEQVLQRRRHHGRAETSAEHDEEGRDVDEGARLAPLQDDGDAQTSEGTDKAQYGCEVHGNTPT